MKSSSFYESVAFESEQTSSDGYGGESTAWQELFSARVQFMYHGGGEELESARLSAKSTYKVRVRSSADSRALSANDRMRDKRRGVIYNIREVDAIGSRRHVYLTVEAGVAT